MPTWNPLTLVGMVKDLVTAANAISTPPATPDPIRQTKYHQKESGKAQAKKANAAASIIALIVTATGICEEMGLPSNAPAR